MRNDDDPALGDIVHAQTEIVEGGNDPSCRAFARCEQDAIVDLRGQLPMHEQFGDELSTKVPGRSAEWYPQLGRTPRERYAYMLKVAERDGAELRTAIGKGTNPLMAESEDWNLAGEEARATEYRKMLELLAGAEDREGE